MLLEIERYLQRTGTKKTALGRAAVGDSRLVDDLRAGRGITSQRSERVRAFMHENPAGVGRCVKRS